MVDEVQTGIGRTGELYAYMHYGVQPDVVSTAKGLAGGLPMGACLMGEKAEHVLGFGDHGSTFGGNPVVAAGAYNIISRIDDKLLAEVREKSAYIFSTLQSAKGVKGVSGKGLMIGIETEQGAPAARIEYPDGGSEKSDRDPVRRVRRMKGAVMDLKGKHFLKLLDFTPAEIGGLIELAAELKAKKKAGIPHRELEGKSIALIFEKTSTRTRCAFEVAAADLGMHPVYLDPSGSQIGKKESIADTARVLGRMFDGIEYRGFGQEIVEELAAYAGVPVWNGLTNEFHPTQILADFLTIKEHFGSLQGKKLVYLGDARYNMGNSLMVGCAKMGMHFVACAPREYFPDEALVAKCREIAKETGAVLEFIEDPIKATKNAEVIYTDVWVSMGEPNEVFAKRIKDLSPYRVTKALMENAGAQCRFMHCLPAFHDLGTVIGREIHEKFGIDCMEVTHEVIEGAQSIVFDEAENRMHTIKAVMLATMK